MKYSDRVAGIAAGAAMAATVFAGLATPAMSGDKANQITGSVLLRTDRIGGNVNYMYALSGDIGAEGVLIRLGGGIGGEDDGDGSKSIDAMVGYQFLEGTWKVRTFGGVTYVDTGTGSAFGAKVMVQAQTRKSGEIYVNATATADSAKMQVQGTLQVGAPLAEVWLGPEAGVVATSEFVRSRLGVVLTGLKLGEVGVTVRGGYSFYQGSGTGKDAPYLGMSATLQY